MDLFQVVPLATRLPDCSSHVTAAKVAPANACSSTRCVIPSKTAPGASGLIAWPFGAASCVATMAFALQARWQPKKTRRGSSMKRRAFEDELGVQAPLGYFDPLGISKDGDFGEFYRRREAELKNGRVAMYATIGYIIPEYFRFPGYLAPSEDVLFEDVPNGLRALGKVPPEGWLQIIVCPSVLF
eukprot:s2928_g5.t3